MLAQSFFLLKLFLLILKRPSGSEAATNRHLDVRFEPALQKTAGLENVGRGQPANSTAIHIAFACSEPGLLAKLSSLRPQREMWRLVFRAMILGTRSPTESCSFSLCESCSHMREIVSGTGSRFVLCQLSQSDRRFPKYPPQPVVRCEGYESQEQEHKQEM